MDKQTIALNSIKFLMDSMNSEECVHPVSSLPFPKEEIKQAIKEYVISGVHPIEREAIKIYYSSLSDFIPDDQVNLVKEVNEELEKVGPRDTEAARQWLSIPSNDERERKVTQILSQTAAERDVLRKEFDNLFSN